MFQPIDAQDNAIEYRKLLRSGMQTSTIFAMSLVGCLLVCGTSQVSAGSDALSSKANSFSFKASENLLDDDEDDYRVQELKEHNAKQAQKIRLLRQELAEKTQSIYEIKGQLFKQIGDPRDKEKIAALNRALETKDELMDQLRLEIQKYDNETVKLEKAIANLEKSREQEQESLKQQIEDMKRVAEINHKDFEKRGRVLETTQLHLSEALENKTTLIAALEHELSKQELAYNAISDELKESVAYFSAMDTENKHALAELRANLEAENLKKIAAKTKLKKTVEEKNTLVENLEHEIENYKWQYELASVDFAEHKEKIESSTSRAFDSLNEQHRQVQNEYNVKVAELTEGLDEAKESSAKFQEWLYTEMQLHTNEKNRSEQLALLSEEKQKRAETLEQSLVLLLEDVNRLETALNEMQKSSEDSIALKQQLDDQTNENKSLSLSLLEKEEHLSALETTLKKIATDTELLEKALASSQEISLVKFADIARLEDNSDLLQKKLEEEINQKAELAEALETEKQNAIALNNKILESKKQVEIQLEEGMATHKALTAALLEQERRAVTLNEDLIVKSNNVEVLENDLMKANDTIEANILALIEAKKDQEDLNEAIIALREDAAKFENTHAASQKVLEENVLALNVSEERIKILENRVEDEKSQKLILSESIQEKQEHVIALEVTLRAQENDMKLMENALAAANMTIEKQTLAISQSEKIIEESDKIILTYLTSLRESEESVRVLEGKVEDEKALKLAAEQKLQEKDVQTAALALGIQTLTLDVERYENALTEAQKYVEGNSIALNEIKEEMAFLEKKLDFEQSKELVLLGVLEEKQKHVLALEETLNAQIEDADRLHIALSDAKGIMETNLHALEESKKMELELEKTQIALAKHQDLLVEQQQVIDSYDKREQR